MLLDFAGNALIPTGAQIWSAFTHILQFTAGSFALIVLSFFALLGILVHAIYRGIKTRSFINAVSTLIRNTAWAVGGFLALAFMLVCAVFFSISFVKLLIIATGIALVAYFIAKETFWFLIFQRFGKYIFYFTTLRRVGKVIITHGKEENAPEEKR